MSTALTTVSLLSKISTIMASVTSPSTTSIALTPASGSYVAPTRTFTCGKTPAKIGAEISSPSVVSTTEILSKYIVALIEALLTRPKPNKIPPRGLF